MILIRPASGREDLSVCADIWLAASVAAHGFVAPDFWKNHHAAMRDLYLPASSVLVAENTGRIGGFSAVREDRLEALFVEPCFWGLGLGSALLRELKRTHARLTVAVYTQNARARGFYTKNGFLVQGKQSCPSTGEDELRMVWHREQKA